MKGGLTILRPLGLAGNETDIEQKFLFNATKQSLLLDWLDCQFVRDPEFYFSPILSLYYDTPSLSCYDEARNGDYLKTKIRLRWYQREIPAKQERLSCFFEIKRKVGAHRQKQRKALNLDPQSLSGDLFSDPALRGLPEAIPEWRLLVRGALVPLLVIEYERFRFVEPHSRTRVSVDTGIVCRRANSAYLAAPLPIRMEVGVLEVKGPQDTLPRSLRPMERHLRKQSFSKYAHCCDLLLDPLSIRRPL
jgi:VTC domain-containing protein